MKNPIALAAGLAATYGLVSIVGGVIGYVSKGSVASVVAGGISGAALIIAAVFMSRKPKPALTTALLLSIILVGRFISASTANGPSTVALVMIIGGAIVALAAGLALAKLRSRPRTAA